VNFIGHILPRCDQGDREFYCLTMLALFKPWRSGLDLKAQKMSWDETFCEHDFTKQQQQMMKNFNIKYECLDARDDFHAQMAAGGVSNEWSINNLELNEDDFDPESDPYTNPTGVDFTDEQDTMSLSNSEKRRQKDAAEIRDVLRRTGWLDQTPAVPTLDLDHFIPQNHSPAATWKTILQAKKADIIEKTLHITNSTPNMVHSFIPNVVQVVDKSYLEKKYYITEHNAFMDGICNDFSLNEEQDRAFRIVANHIVLQNSDPLKMYIGGMGGTGKSRVLNAISVTTFYPYCPDRVPEPSYISSFVSLLICLVAMPLPSPFHSYLATCFILLLCSPQLLTHCWRVVYCAIYTCFILV
jgi:hypothetical protein